VKAAMTYPVVVFIIAILAVIGMLLFIVPGVRRAVRRLRQRPACADALPGLPVRPHEVPGAARRRRPDRLLVVWPKVKRKDGVRNVLDPLKLKLPVFGLLFQKIALARFARNLGTMMKSGVPILQSLDIVSSTTGNVVLERALQDVQDSVRQGEALAAPLAHHPVFPPMVVQMMSVGEDTGALDTMLHKISEFYDQEVEATTEALTALIEPIMIVVIGAIIGGMIIALYMPIFSLMNVIT
jgi:type IV pilus assembly protein PilC